MSTILTRVSWFTDRWQSARDVAIEIESIEERAKETSTRSTTTSDVSTSTEKHGLHSMSVRLVLAAAALVALVGGGWWISNREPDMHPGDGSSALDAGRLADLEPVVSEARPQRSRYSSGVML